MKVYSCKKMKVRSLLLVLFLCASSPLWADKEMFVLQEDISLSEHVDESGKRIGVNLYVKKKPGVESVMLVETTKDPSGKADNYSYRAKEYNSINGDEIRYLNGKELKSEYSKFSIISSTPVKHQSLGECFHLYIPNEMEYGYPWSRHGSVTIGKGTFINIRTFEKKYGDYTGKFQDNPFMFDFPPMPSPAPIILTDDYNSDAAEAYDQIAKGTRGLLTYSRGPETLADDLTGLLDKITPKGKVDIVFAIDTTGSMKDDLQTLKDKWIPRLVNQLVDFEDIRMGLLFYRDYGDNYIYRSLPVKVFPFTKELNQLMKNLRTAVIRGNEGGDVPEAVYEALYASLTFYEWREDAVKKIILIGDAEPHPHPRGSKKMTKENVISIAREKNIVMDCIIVPDDKAESRDR